MKNKIFGIFGAAAMAGGLALAQQQPAQAPKAERHSGRRHMQRMAAELNLTDAQTAQAKGIFQASRESSRALLKQLHDARQQLRIEAQNGAATDVINRDSNAVGSLTGQLAAIRAQNFEKFYAILTPEQKDKLASLRQNFRNRSSNRMRRG